jgi:hypothetical protein
MEEYYAFARAVKFERTDRKPERTNSSEETDGRILGLCKGRQVREDG